MFQLVLVAALAKKLGASRLRGAVRVVGYTTAVTLAVGTVSVHKARAAFEEKSMDLGADMASLASLVGDAHTFTLNGQRIHMGTATTLEGIDAVADKFESSCKTAEGGDVPVWDSIPDVANKPDAEKAKTADLTAIPILRHKEGNKVTVVCFVPSSASVPHSARAVAAAVDSFQQTGHLSAVGKMRYAYLSTSATGTSVATIWTDEEFDIQALVPKAGTSEDTPGSDPALMARPQQSQRLLTGSVEGMPYRIFAYNVQGTPQTAIANYDDQMIKNGWLSLNDPAYENAPHEDAEMRGYMVKDGRQGYVVAFSDKEHHTMMGVVEVGPEGLAKMPTKPAADSDGF
jgi:hypothetical protein